MGPMSNVHAIQKPLSLSFLQPCGGCRGSAREKKSKASLSLCPEKVVRVPGPWCLQVAREKAQGSKDLGQQWVGTIWPSRGPRRCQARCRDSRLLEHTGWTQGWVGGRPHPCGPHHALCAPDPIPRAPWQFSESGFCLAHPRFSAISPQGQGRGVFPFSLHRMYLCCAHSRCSTSLYFTSSCVIYSTAPTKPGLRSRAVGGTSIPVTAQANLSNQTNEIPLQRRSQQCWVHCGGTVIQSL